MTAPLTDEEKRVLKMAAFGAVFMVSQADRGFLAMFKESFAASGVLAGTTGLVRDVLTSGEQPQLPRRPPAAVEAAVLPALSDSVAILAAKAPEELDSYRETVLAAVRRVAAADDGVQAAETVAIDKIRAALGR